MSFPNRTSIDYRVYINSNKELFLIGLLLPVLLIAGCRERIDLKFGAEDRKLVVDGFITDALRSHEIRLSYSSGFTEEGAFEPEYEESASIFVVDDRGDQVTFVHQSQGLYSSPVFQADPNRSYRLIVVTENGRYTSTFKSLPESTAPINISYREASREELSETGRATKMVNGVSVISEIAPSSHHSYYLWIQENHYVYEAVDFPGGDQLGRLEQDSSFFEFEESIFNDGINEWWYRLCYVHQLDFLLKPQLDVFEKRANAGSSNFEVELDFIPCSAKMEHDYAVRVRQLNIDMESFQFWNSIKTSIEGVGGIFDPAPFSIPGNIQDESGNGVLGYFGVYRESSTDIFFSNEELGNCDQENSDSCPGDHSIDTDPCLDCEKALGHSALKDKPAWWR